jgi:hypothetical protein
MRNTGKNRLLTVVCIFRFVIVLFLFVVTHSYAQGRADSLEFASFIKRIHGTFTREQVQKIVALLPAKCKIFAYDAGDFSGDSLPDLAVSVRIDAAARRELSLYFILNVRDGFTIAHQCSRTYLNEPIEIGFAVEQGKCLVTQKLGDMRWLIEGYVINDLIFRKVSRWETGKVKGGLGWEMGASFENWSTEEVFYRISDQHILAKNRFLMLPVFGASGQRPREISSGFEYTDEHSILAGSSSWFGQEDCSFRMSAERDSEIVTLRCSVQDERILLTGNVKTSDRLELWFAPGSTMRCREAEKMAKQNTRVFCVQIMMDSSGVSWPQFALETKGMDIDDQALLKRITVGIGEPGPGIHEITCGIPRQLLPDGDDGLATSFCGVYYDHDNADHPEWETVCSTSAQFKRSEPSSFGAMRFMDDLSLFELHDLRLAGLVARMANFGLMP